MKEKDTKNEEETKNKKEDDMKEKVSAMGG